MTYPRVTLGIHAYNQERYIKEAVLSVLAQDYSPLEIILSDDASTDRTWEIIKETVGNYTGPHKIVLNRNAQNLYIGGHLNKLHQLATGEIYVQAAGDDISHPSRVSEIVKVFMGDSDVGLVISDWIEIDKEGVEKGPISFVGHIKRMKDSFKGFCPETLTLEEDIKFCYPFIGAATGWRRELFDFFGPIPSNLAAEDRILPFRALLLEKKIAHLSKPLVSWRSVGLTSTPGLDPYREWKFKEAQNLLLWKTFLSDARLAKRSPKIIRMIEKYTRRQVYLSDLFAQPSFARKGKILLRAIIKSFDPLYFMGEFIKSVYVDAPSGFKNVWRSAKKNLGLSR